MPIFDSLFSPEALAYFRKLEGGPETVDHIAEVNADGWLLKPTGFEQRPDDGYLVPMSGSLHRIPLSHGVTWALFSMGDVFRGPDHHHYQPVYGLAKTRERITELHWLTGFCPVSIDRPNDFFSFNGQLVCYVGGPGWPHTMRGSR